jgi:precorrin-6x reductase
MSDSHVSHIQDAFLTADGLAQLERGESLSDVAHIQVFGGADGQIGMIADVGVWLWLVDATHPQASDASEYRARLTNVIKRCYEAT